MAAAAEAAATAARPPAEQEAESCALHALPSLMFSCPIPVLPHRCSTFLCEALEAAAAAAAEAAATAARTSAEQEAESVALHALPSLMFSCPQPRPSHFVRARPRRQRWRRLPRRRRRLRDRPLSRRPILAIHPTTPLFPTHVRLPSLSLQSLLPLCARPSRRRRLPRRRRRLRGRPLRPIHAPFMLPVHVLLSHPRPSHAFSTFLCWAPEAAATSAAPPAAQEAAAALAATQPAEQAEHEADSRGSIPTHSMRYSPLMPRR